MTPTTVTTPDGFGLSVQVTGREDGPVLLLLPGQANSHAWWTETRPAFEERCRVVTFDYRGTGGSRGPVERWTTASFADDAACVIAAVGDEPVGVYGTSMGGRVAQVLAAEHPERVRRLALACTSPGGPHAHERGTDVRRELSDPDPAKRRATLRRLFYTDAWPHRPEDSHLFGDPTMTTDESRAHLRVSARHDAWDLLPRIACPTLVLHGTDDLMVPGDNAALIAERIPGATTYLHEGGRHGFFEEFAHDITPRVLDLLHA
ncbi:alpha/beta fold hydrolase [Nocardioides lijunqiniae]|uniref:alpha/beta fold hydrolase n=1 Tax=Nocardioides lijunqiniae TaxID=2760832 RepID=UPI001878DAA8|nr:alpha/beta hydrolase [Nocardioides lijunqiniae]